VESRATARKARVVARRCVRGQLRTSRRGVRKAANASLEEDPNGTIVDIVALVIPVFALAVHLVPDPDASAIRLSRANEG
jgi:hypothetical protein